MILVDSSVLIGYLRGDETEAVQKFEQVIERRLPFGISPLIFTEVLQGAATEKDFDLLAEYLGGQRFYDLRAGLDSYRAAARMYFDLRRKGVPVRGTVDCLIAQTAIENDLYLLHGDADFDRIAKHVPLKIWA
jgi:predicted nucleic acid-binding protein